MNYIVKAEGFVLKIIRLIAESADVSLPHLTAWYSVQHGFIANIRENVERPKCVERANHFALT
jgi:hypothetical protein